MWEVALGAYSQGVLVASDRGLRDNARTANFNARLVLIAKDALLVIDEAVGPTMMKGRPGGRTWHTRVWAMDLAVNAPNNQVIRRAEILERVKQHAGWSWPSSSRYLLNDGPL